MTFDVEEDTSALGEGLPSYTQDVSPPLYAVDSDEEDFDQIRSIRDYYTSYFERSCRMSLRDIERDIELGFMSHEQTMDRFLRRMSASPSPPGDSARRSAREQYEFTDTGRADSYGIDDASTSGRSVSGTPAPESIEETPNPSRGAQGWNHSWASPVSQSPPNYYTLEPLPLSAAAAATTSPASTATPTPDLSNTSTPAQRTPDVSPLSTPEIPRPAYGIPSPLPYSYNSSSPSRFPSVHISVTEPPSSSNLARLGTNLFLEPTSRTPSSQITPAATRQSAAHIRGLPSILFGPLRSRCITVTTTARRPRASKQAGWKCTVIRWTIGFAAFGGVAYGVSRAA